MTSNQGESMAGEKIELGVSWVVLELMGHVRLAGRVSEVEMFGSKMGRLDIPMPDGSFVSRFFGGSSVYSMTPVSERVARDVAKGCSPEPVSPWDYPKQLAVAPQSHTPYPEADLYRTTSDLLREELRGDEDAA